MRLKFVVFLCIASVALCFTSVSVSANEVARKVEGATLRATPVLVDSAWVARVASQVKAFGILKRSCAVSGCHTGKHPEDNLLLDPSGVLKSTKNVPSREISSLKRVDTQKPEKSYLLMKIRGDAGIRGKRMPRGAPPLSKEEIKIIELWLQSLSVAENADKNADSTGQGSKSDPSKTGSGKLNTTRTGGGKS